jgi:hypothetical protein
MVGVVKTTISIDNIDIRAERLDHEDFYERGLCDEGITRTLDAL